MAQPPPHGLPRAAGLRQDWCRVECKDRNAVLSGLLLPLWLPSVMKDVRGLCSIAIGPAPHSLPGPSGPEPWKSPEKSPERVPRGRAPKVPKECAPESQKSPKLTCFHASFFPFCPFFWPPLFLPFSQHIFAIFSPSKSALFCRAKGTVQSLERGSSGMHLSTKFGKEIPS